MPRLLRIVSASNPLRESGRIHFEIDDFGAEVFVTVAIHDVLGRQVRALPEGLLPPGDHSVVWDGRNSHGNVVSPGIYFCRLNAAGQDAVQPILVVR